jgi:hypothetical protein
MTRACLSLLPLTLLFALACNPVVISGSSSNPDQGGSPPTDTGSETSGSTTPETPPGPPAIQADNIAAPKGDVLEIALGNYLETCGPSAFDHYPENATPCHPTSSWRIRLNIPLASLQVGTVMPFPDISAGFDFSIIDPNVPYDPKYGCGGGGGSYWSGTVEVLSLTATTLRLRLAGTDKFIDGTGNNGDGDYDVTLCGPTGLPAHLLTGAIATTAGQTLTLAATNLPTSCASPAVPAGGCAIERDWATIDLPPAMQAVGTYPLTNVATFSTSGPDAYGNCAQGAGSYWNGTIQIVSIDASQVVFTLAGTDQHFIAAGTADGTYVAPRCN